MSTVLNNILPHLQFRRPALQRQSVLLPFHRIIHECIRRGIAIEVEPGLAQLELVAAQIGPHTKGLFPFNVESELMKVRPFVNIFVEVLHDQVWDHFMSGYSSKDFLINLPSKLFLVVDIIFNFNKSPILFILLFT